jgi:Ulp1 family protease
MEKLMNLWQTVSTEDAVYNYGAVKSWVEKKLLPKQRVGNKKTSKAGFQAYIDSGILYIPINWNSHWILVTANIEDQTISIYNSDCLSTIPRFDDGGYGIFALGILRCLHDFYEDIQLGNFDPHDWTCHFPPCSLQENAVDCGVFVLAHIHMLASGHFSCLDVNGSNWRKYILNCLVLDEII